MSEAFARYRLLPALRANTTLQALPSLEFYTEDMHCTWEDAPRVLRAEPPLAELQLRNSLEVHFEGQDCLVCGMERFGPFAAALADATLQPALLQVEIHYADTAQPALIDGRVDGRGGGATAA
jgi:hypothetical protein